jgi:hypothetical protein
MLFTDNLESTPYNGEPASIYDKEIMEGIIYLSKNNNNSNVSFKVKELITTNDDMVSKNGYVSKHIHIPKSINDVMFNICSNCNDMSMIIGSNIDDDPSSTSYLPFASIYNTMMIVCRFPENNIPNQITLEYDAVMLGKNIRLEMVQLSHKTEHHTYKHGTSNTGE